MKVVRSVRHRLVIIIEIAMLYPNTLVLLPYCQVAKSTLIPVGRILFVWDAYGAKLTIESEEQLSTLVEQNKLALGDSNSV